MSKHYLVYIDNDHTPFLFIGRTKEEAENKLFELLIDAHHIGYTGNENKNVFDLLEEYDIGFAQWVDPL